MAIVNLSLCVVASLFPLQRRLLAHIYAHGRAHKVPPIMQFPIVLPCGTRWLKSTHRTSAHNVQLRGVPDEVSGMRCRIFIDAHVPGPGPINC